MDLQLINALQISAQPGDYILFNTIQKHGKGLGVISNVTQGGLEVTLFKCLDSSICRKFSIQPIAATNYSFAAQSGMVEVYKTDETISISRSQIRDVAFILSAKEVESGMFYLARAENTFFVRYTLERGFLSQYEHSTYFCRYFIEPFHNRLFTTLNTLSQNLQRSLYHLAESASPSRTFRLQLFSMESFMYLAYKIQQFSVGTSVIRKQRVTQYYNTLKMECITKENVLTYIRIASTGGLTALRNVVGMSVDIGVTKKRPTKSNPVVHCTIGSILTCIECGPEIPEALIRKPESRSYLNGIDFVYSEQNRNLTCTVRFSKITISSADVATTRIATAEVVSQESNVYVGVWFHHDGELLEVQDINNNTVTCSNVHDESLDAITLPLNLVENLVKAFGR
jgi:hypothetical protein